MLFLEARDMGTEMVELLYWVEVHWRRNKTKRTEKEITECVVRASPCGSVP
jgi:hypothetical protein